MQLNLDENEVHWLRHALIEAAAKSQGTKAQEIYLNVVAKLSEPLSAGYLGEPPAPPGSERSKNSHYLGGG